MNKIIVRRSTGGWLFVAVIALFCILSGINRLQNNARGGYLLPCIGFVVFASAAIQLIITRPRVIIDEEGISGVWMGNVKVPWKRIRWAEYKHEPRGDPVITLILDDNTTRIMILGGVTVSPQRIFSEITAYIREQGADATNAPAPTSEEDDDFE